MKASLIAFLLLLLFPVSALAQTGADPGQADDLESEDRAVLYTLDLAASVAERFVEAGTVLRFKVTNRLPDERYRYRMRKSTIVLPPLFKPAGDELNQQTFAHSDTTCKALRSTLKTMLSDATTEAKLPTFNAWIGHQDADAACQDSLRKDFVALTTHEPFGAVTLKRGQTLEIVVERMEAGQVAFSQTFTFSTGPTGTWHTSYGFTFVPRRGDVVFTRPSATDSLEFDIIEEDPPSGLDFLPTITFTWVPAKKKRWFPSFSAGFGADLEEVAVFAGASYLIGQNVSLHLGAALHRVDRRRAHYEGVQTVRENLTVDQLTEKVFVPNFILGISFRLGTNPFRREGADDTSPSGSNP